MTVKESQVDVTDFWEAEEYLAEALEAVTMLSYHVDGMQEVIDCLHGAQHELQQVRVRVAKAQGVEVSD